MCIPVSTRVSTRQRDRDEARTLFRCAVAAKRFYSFNSGPRERGFQRSSRKTAIYLIFILTPTTGQSDA
jgi:hypothetical protein